MRNRGASNLIFVIVGGIIVVVIAVVVLRVVGQNAGDGPKETNPQVTAPLNAVTSQPAPSQQPNTVTGEKGMQ
ncbi:MAG TPA: hypothetical protein VF624_01195 [Tepidisphaeraceae bacterium]|jgi:hypothetical protein